MNGQDMKQFLDGIAEAAKKASGIYLKDFPGAEGQKFLLYNHATGTVEVMVKPEQNPKLKVLTPGDLVDFIDKADGAFKASEKGALIVQPEVLTYLPNVDDTRTQVHCELERSPQYQWFLDHAGQQIDQKTLVRDLRVTLGGCISDGLLPAVRSVKWNSMTAQDIGANSLGKAATADLQTGSPVPDTVTVTLPVYGQFRMNYTFACFVEVEPETQRFRLTPYPLALDGIAEAAQRDIAKLYDDAGVQVIVSAE